MVFPPGSFFPGPPERRIGGGIIGSILYARAGRLEEARATLEAVQAMAQKQFVSPYGINEEATGMQKGFCISSNITIGKRIARACCWPSRSLPFFSSVTS